MSGRFATDPNGTVRTSEGQRVALPDPAALEDAVDRVLMSWPPGSFDSVGDFVNNPTQTPDSFTWGDHPFNWSGGLMAGPFNGLSVQTNNVHSLNSDPFNQTAQIERSWAWTTSSPRLQVVQVTGEGHQYWVDEQAGFSSAEQRALVLYLLSYAPDPRTPLPRPAPPPPRLGEALAAFR
jgi:hypothetical protein